MRPGADVALAAARLSVRPGGPILDCPGPSRWPRVALRVVVYGGWLALFVATLLWLAQPVPR